MWALRKKEPPPPPQTGELGDTQTEGIWDTRVEAHPPTGRGAGPDL